MSVDKPLIPKQLTIANDLASLFSSESDIDSYEFTDLSLTPYLQEEQSISESRLSKVDFLNVEVDKISIRDCELKSCTFSANKFLESYWLRVSIKSSRCVGIDMRGSILRNVSFTDTKLDFVNFRKSKLEDVTFKDCILNDVDFNHGNLKNVQFINCTLTDVTFNNAHMKNIDIAQSTIERIKGIDSIKGVTVSDAQLMQLSPLLLTAAGIHLKT